MLTGAMRAARKTDALRFERVWVVAVPVLVVLYLERIVQFILVHVAMGWMPFPGCYLVGRRGPIALRTALLLAVGAAAAYALVWAAAALLEYLGDVRRTGRRILVGGSGGRFFVLGSLFLILATQTMLATQLPTAEDEIASVRAEFASGSWWRFRAAVSQDVPGIRAFCREQIDAGNRNARLMAAMGLFRFGDRSPETLEVLRGLSREEFLGERQGFFWPQLQLVRLGIGGYSYHRATPEEWERFREEIR